QKELIGWNCRRKKISPPSHRASRLLFQRLKRIGRASHMNRLSFEKLWLTLGFGFVALVFYLSLAPDLPDTGVPNGMKIGHVLAYGWLMFWFAQIYRSNAMRYAFALVFCAMGIGLEYAQHIAPRRRSIAPS